MQLSSKLLLAAPAPMQPQRAAMTAAQNKKKGHHSNECRKLTHTLACNVHSSARLIYQAMRQTPIRHLTCSAEAASYPSSLTNCCQPHPLTSHLSHQPMMRPTSHWSSSEGGVGSLPWACYRWGSRCAPSSSESASLHLKRNPDDENVHGDLKSSCVHAEPPRRVPPRTPLPASCASSRCGRAERPG